MTRRARVGVGLHAVVLTLLGVGGAALGDAQAQGLLTMQKLSAPLANELVGDAVAQCAQKGYAVTAVVVDLDGVRQAMLRGNGAPIHTLDNAFYKAYSAASLTLTRKEDSTKAAADRAADAIAQCHVCGRWGDDHGRWHRDWRNRREWGAWRPIR